MFLANASNWIAGHQGMLGALVTAVLLAGGAPATAMALEAHAPVVQNLPDEPVSIDEQLESGRLALRGGDFGGAKSIFLQLAARGHARALGYLAEIAEHGLGTRPDVRAAASQYRQAGELGDVESLARLGLLLLHHRGLASPAGVPNASSLKEGLALVQAAADAGDAYGRYALGLLKFEGMLVEPNMERALRLIESSAQSGLIEAQGFLGRLYIEGRGVQRHEIMALTLLTEAARQGEIDAMAALGSMYRSGEGVERDPKEAMYWLERASERNQPSAMGQLALMLFEGKDVRGDPNRALALWRDAAQAGDAPSRFYFGLSLVEGRGLPRNLTAGLRWIEAAAQQGFADARRYLDHARQ